MKKLNKLLLMGAALSGALVPKTGAHVDIKVNDIVTDFEKSGDEYLNNNIKDEIESNYKITLDGLVWNDDNYDRVRYYILKGLEKYLEIPIIKENLEKYEEETGNKFAIKFQTDFKKDSNTTMGSTNWKGITLFGKALINNDIKIKGNKRYLYMGHKLALQNIKDRWNITKSEIDAYYIQSTLAHELGHFVNYVEEAKRNEKNGEKFNRDDDDRIWLRQFNGEYYHDLKKNKNIKNFPWADLLESEYGNNKLSDWFAESFCRAVFPGDHMGESEVSKQFEQTLSRLSGIENCLTPNKSDPKSSDSEISSDSENEKNENDEED